MDKEVRKYKNNTTNAQTISPLSSRRGVGGEVKDSQKANIELRSEKVRNIIGQVPPVFIRIGNLLIFFSLIILVIIGSVVKSPDLLHCSVRTVEENGKIKLGVTYISKMITKPVPKGNKIKLYKDDVLLYEGVLSDSLSAIKISRNTIQTFLPVVLPDSIILQSGMRISISENTLLDCEIEIDNKPVLKKIIPLL